MIKTTASILIFATILVGIGAYRLARPPVHPQTCEPAPSIPIQVDASKTAVLPLKPVRVPRSSLSLKPNPEPKKVQSPPAKSDPSTAQRRASARYWQQQAAHFDRQKQQLANETDKAKRMGLIRTMGRYARIDTLGAVEWAMGLKNLEERQMALDAINDHALTGIGARLEMSEAGLPKIKETTILSAVAATGSVETGDDIAGMMRNDGTIIYFKNRPIREIVKYLRGKAGTELHLLMERASDDGSDPYSYDVTVQRSLIVMQRPF